MKREPPDLEKIAIDRIHQLRREKGMTQEKLAERADLTAEAVTCVERGVRMPTLKTLGKLVRVEPTQEGVFLRFVVDVAEKDAWWAKEPHKSQLQQALAWAAKNPPAESDLGALLARATSTAKPSSRAAKTAAKRAQPRRAARKR